MIIRSMPWRLVPAQIGSRLRPGLRCRPRSKAMPAAYALLCASCTYIPRPTDSEGTSKHCLLVEEGHGPKGETNVTAETVVDGLEVPWGVAFMTPTEWLVTERPGRLRLVRDGVLQPDPVARVETGGTAESEQALRAEIGAEPVLEA